MIRIVIMVIALLTMSLDMTSAHTYVHTEEGSKSSVAGAAQVYRLQVQVERNVPTVQVRLVPPQGMYIARYFPAPGWTHTAERDASGKLTAVVWRGQLQPDELIRFYFQAGNPDTPGTLVWRVYQLYADGVEVAWDDHDASHPADRTEIVARPRN